MTIDVKDLKYIYSSDMPGATTALDGVSFSVDGPCIIGIIGHTGSGKSTLLQHLNGLIKPTSGDIYIDGECITNGKKNLVDIRRNIGLVFQYPEYQLFEENVEKDVSFGPRNIGVEETETEDRVRRAIELVGLDYEDIREKSPFELSGGMKQRAIIAMALACNAKILIADEPTTALDVTIQAQIMKLLNDIRINNKTSILLITHDLALVSENSQQVSVMYAGRIVESAPSGEFFNHPNHPYSKALLNSIPSLKNQTLESIKGQPPTLSQNISGCRFHPRCNYCFDKCSMSVPELVEINQNHFCACFLND